ncbi:MAG TPA: ferrochelatase [Geminicoccaceae bacterium]
MTDLAERPAAAHRHTSPIVQAAPSGEPERESGYLPADHPPLKPEKIGVLLLNLGTPDATTYWPMRRYLKEFLSDKRVIDVNPLLWKPLLNLVILTSRPFRSGKAYRSIWNRDLDESPLRTITRAQAAKIGAALEASGADGRVVVDWAMRYGNPSTAAVVRRLIEAGCTRLLMFALYPQYAAPTTATAYDQAFRALMEERWQPAIRTVGPYHDHPGYIEAIARSIEDGIGRLDFEPEVVLASFHGLPKRYLLLGDPYHCHCCKTARLVRERLGWDERRFRLTFQSRFGSEEWLQPYTDETIKQLASAGVKRIAVITPGFSADCVETLEEIAIGGREAFEEHGGERFAFIPCLNDQPDHIDLLAGIIRRELQGWN